MIRAQIGAALLDWWALSPLEAEALAFASQGKLTETEEAEQERRNQKQLAAALGAKPKA